jgi:hypothetical protein
MTSDRRPKVVTEGGDLTCLHGGKRTLTGLTSPAGTPTVKLTVGRSPVIPVKVVPGDATYDHCAIPPDAGDHKTHPCISTAVTTAGAARLTVGGHPVLLDNDTVTTSNDLSATFSATVHPAQSTLTAS